VGGSPESIQAQKLWVACHRKRPKADQAGTKQRSYVDIGGGLGQQEAKAIACHRVVGKAAVYLVAGKASFVAQILAATCTEPALSTSPAKPRNAYPSADLKLRSRVCFDDGAHNLMAGDERKLGLCELSINYVEVGPAHTAGVHLYQKLALASGG
jgi:hypothetical protein